MSKENLNKEKVADLPEPIELKSEPPKKKKDDKKIKSDAPKYDASLKELVEKSIEWSQVIYDQNKKIKRRLTLMVIGSYLKLVLIIAPIILAIIFLPTLLEGIMSQYGGLLGGVDGMPSIGEIFSQGLNLDIGSILSNMNPEEAAKIQNTLKTLPK